jgi:hypothetical protein
LNAVTDGDVFNAVICNIISALIVLNLAAVDSAFVVIGSADGIGPDVVVSVVVVDIIDV